MRRFFSFAEVEQIKHMVRTGHSAIAIARQLDRPALAIRRKCCDLGLQLRPKRIVNKKRVVIGAEVLAMLTQAATRRGITPTRLANRLLSVCAFEPDLIANILDDLTPTDAWLMQATKAKPKPKAKPRPERRPQRDVNVTGGIISMHFLSAQLSPPEFITGGRIEFADDHHRAAMREGVEPDLLQ